MTEETSSNNRKNLTTWNYSEFKIIIQNRGHKRGKIFKTKLYVKLRVYRENKGSALMTVYTTGMLDKKEIKVID